MRRARRPQGPKAVPRKVDFATEDQDFAVWLYAACGLSTRFIEGRTGLTPSQIGYRVKAAQVKRKDYRDGDSEVTNIVLESPQLKGQIRTYVKAWTKGRGQG